MIKLLKRPLTQFASRKPHEINKMWFIREAFSVVTQNT